MGGGQKFFQCFKPKEQNETNTTAKKDPPYRSEIYKRD